MSEFCSVTAKITRFRFSKGEKIAFISVPTPILMEGDKVFSPNRTNYFPISQLILATCLKNRLDQENVPWSVSFCDFKSLENTNNWDKKLISYGEVKYGDKLLTKYVIGDGLERIKHELSDKSIICITANFTFESNVIKKVIQLIKKENKNSLIIVGGKDASARPDFYLADNGADIVAVGDSDLALPEFIIRLYKGENINDICENGILLKMKTKINMNRLPFLDFSLIKGTLHRYNESGGGGFLNSILKNGNIAYFETSRGCCRECDFCTKRLSHYSAMCLDRFREKVDWYKKHHISTIMFIDDNLMQRMNKGVKGEQELLAMFDYLKQQKMTWEFPVGLEVGKFINSGVDHMREMLSEVMLWNNDSILDFSGAFRLLFPIENSLTEEEGEKHFSKLRCLEDNLKILLMTIAKGIPQINMGIMFGWRFESKEKIKSIVARIDKIQRYCNHINENSNRNIKSNINYSIFCVTPLPGTPFYQQMVKERRIAYDIEKDPELWNLYTSILQGEYYKPHEITGLRQELLNIFGSQQKGGKVRFHLNKKYPVKENVVYEQFQN